MHTKKETGRQPNIFAKYATEVDESPWQMIEVEEYDDVKQRSKSKIKNHH